MKPAIRKIVTYVENTLIEGGKMAPRALRLIG
ncbi:MAG: amino acid synthesis family protein, partial [Mesorhizobium sp.]